MMRNRDLITWKELGCTSGEAGEAEKTGVVSMGKMLGGKMLGCTSGARGQMMVTTE